MEKMYYVVWMGVNVEGNWIVVVVVVVVLKSTKNILD